jgi:ATP-dependent helicase/nuclease subunit B
MRELVLLDWTTPTAEAVALWLLAGCTATGCADLSSTLVLVPTQQSGRRLREALARHTRECGLLAPTLRTPAQFLQPEGARIADSVESLAVLAGVLDKFREGELTRLFAQGAPFHSFAQRVSFARLFLSLRATLVEAGFTVETALRSFEDDADFARWSDLTRVETAYLAALRKLNLLDRDEARFQAAKSSPYAGCIIVACVADLPPLVTETLSRLEIPVTVLVAAEPGDEESFDEWGRPKPEHWEHRDPGWDRPDERIQLVARPEDAPDALAALLPGPPDGGRLEIGALDAALLPRLRDGIEASGGALHDPEGEPLHRHWLATLLARCGEFFEDGGFDAARELLEHGAVLARLRVDGVNSSTLLHEADHVRTTAFPESVEEALRGLPADKLETLRRALEELEALRRACEQKNWPEALRRFLESTMSVFPVPPQERAALDAAASAIGGLLDRAEELAVNRTVTAAEWIRLAVEALRNQRHYPERPPNAVEAAGWLELPWSDAPHLVLAGFNQGLVPAPLARNPLLPERLRARLGLPGERERAARDAYFTARLLTQRRGDSGRVDVLVLQIDAQENPLRPSRLLFAGAGDELAGRVRRLFVEPKAARPDPAWHAGWRFDPRIVEIERKISVTGFARYLECPFAFYLRFGLGMEEFDPEPEEMDARVFGRLVHDALQRFAENEATRDLAREDDIRVALHRSLDAYVRTRFGEHLSLPLAVQVDSARQRLGAFARAQAELRGEGWRIHAVERTFEDLAGGPWMLGGWEIRGRIDRIDVHADGRVRVLDYKTGNEADEPRKKHLARPRGPVEWPPDYARVDDKRGQWRNLQLPLYRQLLVEAGFTPDAISCAYLNLPKTLADTGVYEWSNFDAELADSALHCARGVLADIDAHRFWPPNPRASHWEIETFFPAGIEPVIDPNGAFRAWSQAQ